MEEYLEIALMVIAIVMTVLTVYFGPQYIKGKKIFKKFRELIVEADNALADDKITREELHDILERARDLYYEIIGKT